MSVAVSKGDHKTDQMEDAERASHALPEQIARARASLDHYLDNMSRLERQRDQGEQGD